MKLKTATNNRRGAGKKTRNAVASGGSARGSNPTAASKRKTHTLRTKAAKNAKAS